MPGLKKVYWICILRALSELAHCLTHLPNTPEGFYNVEDWQQLKNDVANRLAYCQEWDKTHPRGRGF